jgi:hypothetical protein
MVGGGEEKGLVEWLKVKAVSDCEFKPQYCKEILPALGKSLRPTSKTTKAKTGQAHGSSGRVPV